MDKLRQDYETLQRAHEKLKHEHDHRGINIDNKDKQLYALNEKLKAVQAHRKTLHMQSMGLSQNSSTQPDQAQQILAKKHEELQQQYDALVKENESLKTRQNATANASLRKDHQIQILKSELAMFECHTNTNKPFHADVDDDDDDEHVVRPQASRQLRQELHMAGPEASRQLRQELHSVVVENNAAHVPSPEAEVPVQLSDARKRRLNVIEDEDEDEDEDEAEQETISKRLRMTSITPGYRRHPRQAATQGEQRRKDLWKATALFKFELITGYSSTGKATRLATDECSAVMLDLSEKIDKLKSIWEDWKGVEWFLDTLFLSKRASFRRFCITSKAQGYPTLWRRADDGRFACQRCVERNVPCFTYSSTADKFFMLPLHHADRSAMPGTGDESRFWINDH